mmetsp:Transcript_33140/g.66854  ORF Transcript_33140/g.66854 Transcript_33140/m.66854 type:complete len:440 (-) Transcript_33140:1901-3220(-)
MTGVAVMKKRCGDDEVLNRHEAIIAAANALTGLSGGSAPSSSSDGSCFSAASTSLSSSTPPLSSASSSSSSPPSESTGIKPADVSVSFPEKLMEILSTLESESPASSSTGSSGQMSEQPISWLPSGDGFVISRPNEFTLNVLPRFFSQSTEFSSFTRKLYWWGFRKVSKGSGCEAFHHRYFRRSEPGLCRKMKGRSKKKKKSNSSRSKEAIAGAKKAGSRVTSKQTSKSSKDPPTSTVSTGVPQVSPQTTATPGGASSLPFFNGIGISNSNSSNTVAVPSQSQTNANLLVNNLSPLVAGAGLSLQQQVAAAAAVALQQQVAQNQTAAQAAIQRLVLQQIASTNQSVALANAQPQQQQQFNVAAQLAALQQALCRGGLVSSAPSPALLAVPTPLLLPQHAISPALSAAAASIPGRQVVIHAHHHKTADGKEYVTFSQGPE